MAKEKDNGSFKMAINKLQGTKEQKVKANIGDMLQVKYFRDEVQTCRKTEKSHHLSPVRQVGRSGRARLLRKKLPRFFCLPRAAGEQI